MCLCKSQQLWLTDDMPQCDNVVITRGRQAEWRRLYTAPAIVIGMKSVDNKSTGKVEGRRQCSFAPRVLCGVQGALRTRPTDTLQLGGIGEHCFVSRLSLTCHPPCLGVFREVLYRHKLSSLPVYNNGQAHSTKCCQKPNKSAFLLHFDGKGTNNFSGGK